MAALLIALSVAREVHAQPGAATVQFWNHCVAAVESRIQSRGDTVVSVGSAVSVVTRGSLPDACAVPDNAAATVLDWRGSVDIPHTTVNQLLDSLAHDLPRQKDVLSATFLSASPNSVKVYLRLVRRKIITVVYDTEHEMTFDRRSPTLAFSRSVMTKIAEVEDAGTAGERHRDGDRGFLWKLNSYSTYTQDGDSVLVRMESLTLSRAIPAFLRPIAAPIVESIARESMLRTLEGLRHRFDPRAH